MFDTATKQSVLGELFARRQELLDALRVQSPELVGELEETVRLITFVERRPTQAQAAAHGASVSNGSAEIRLRPTRSEPPKPYLVSTFDNGAVLTVKEATKSALDLGWTTDSQDPESVVRTTLRRMADKNIMERMPDGRFRKPRQTPVLLPPEGERQVV